jgi:hypothetical protein
VPWIEMCHKSGRLETRAAWRRHMATDRSIRNPKAYLLAGKLDLRLPA